MNTKIKKTAAIALGAIAFGLAQQLPAQSVANGNFSANGGSGQIGYNTTLSSWTTVSGSYSFLFNSSTLDSAAPFNTTGALGDSGYVTMTGPGNGTANGLALSPAGGWVLGVDADYENQGGISQSITGLTMGKEYAVSFYWGGVEQFGFSGVTSEGWNVSLGGGTPQSVDDGSLASGAFSGWNLATLDFTANAGTETLSFLAEGTGGSGLPPFSLLDGVSISQVTTAPDAASTAVLLGLATSAMGIAARFRRARR